MTMQEFRQFEKQTYNILEQFKPFLKSYIFTWGPLEIRTVKETLTNYAREFKQIILPQEFDNDLFNFITDAEFARWLEREKIGLAFERTDFVIQKPPKEEEDAEVR